MPGTDLPPAEKIEITYQELVALYGKRPLVPRRDPMHELVSTMLSHRTTQRTEARAFRALWDRFGSWEAIRDAPPEAVIEAIQQVTFAENKGPRIQETLRQIIEARGEPNIDFLAEWPLEDALAWLTALPGVGVKTATLVLLFSLGRPVLPVDTHVHRVSQRVGLIPPGMGAGPAHDRLLEMLPGDPLVLFNFHKALLKHGQQVCTFRSPRCERCPLTAICNWYAENRRGSQLNIENV